MVRILGVAGLVLGLAGCVTTNDGAWWREWAGPSVGRYHFDWRLSGDADLAPLQVFDDGRDTWLQYPAGQPAPALFARSAAGDRLLRARREGDYLVLRGVPDHLLMRGGLLQAEARRVVGVDTAPAPAPAPIPVPSMTVAADPAASAAEHRPALPEPAVPSPTVDPVPARRPAPVVAAARRVPAASAPPAPVVPVSRPFQVTPADGNVRRALARWAGLAGWTFEAEHWAVDVDIPLAGSAAFGDAFRPAVRSLLAATELGDRPVQPCFYANQVLRVVPLAQRCDRTQAPGGES